MPTVSEVEAYIRRAAMRRGIDPDVAVRVAKAERLAPGIWQSNVYRNGVREPSYGPFQLYTGGGLGNEFQRLTGRSAADRSTLFPQVEFALDRAATGGWGPWHGAREAGIGRWEGLQGAQPSSTMSSTGTEKRAGNGRSWADRLAAAGRAFDQAANEYPAPAIRAPFGGGAGATGNGLVQLLQDPRPIAKALLARRMG
jgi:hypothetical protein